MESEYINVSVAARIVRTLRRVNNSIVLGSGHSLSVKLAYPLD